jgi:hypothetical protein
MAKRYFYWNLHRNVWSVMVRGKVQRHTHCAQLFRVEFRVRPAGHARVLREGRKNVHAFAVAEQASYPSSEGQTFAPLVPDDWIEISYNPFKGAAFFRKDTGEAVTYAARVVLTDDKRVFAQEVR